VETGVLPAGGVGATPRSPGADAPSAVRPEILERPVFERLLFAQCWEDPRMDVEALRVGPGQTALVVTSGGCTALSLALLGLERVVAVDLNAAQGCLLELKIAGARRLGHREYLELLGARESARRPRLYLEVRGALGARARDYWDRHGRDLERGVLGAGRYERYLGLFRGLLRLMHGRDRIERLCRLNGPEEQRRFYEQEWNTAAWRLFFRVFFSRRVLGAAGLDPAFFTYVEGIPDFGVHFLSLARHALVDLPARGNYFLHQICLGRYLDERALPPYLLSENFGALQDSLDRIEVVTDEVGAVLGRLPDASVDAFAYSNVFEWVPPSAFEAMLRETHRVARPGARLCYRNLLVRRRHPPALDGLFEPDDDVATRLLREDRSFVYSHFEVATALKPARSDGAPAPEVGPGPAAAPEALAAGSR
jgi:S-adenosylmethionine-diacylglycerol 3-amino-3-carboxypropyl transferase